MTKIGGPKKNEILSIREKKKKRKKKQSKKEEEQKEKKKGKKGGIKGKKASEGMFPGDGSRN